MKSLVALAGALVIAGIVGSWLRISAQNPDKPNARTSGGQVRFTDVTGKSGIRFTHNHGGSGRHYYAETMSGGGAFLDYDGDGWLDILLLQGAPLPGTQTSQNLKPHLYRNKRDGTFDETTDSAGLADSYYGMGAATGDYNRDGRTDLYITSLAGNRLYRNEGGRFREVTKLAGVGGKDMSTSAAWLDYDRDGFLDLFVCRYMDYEVETNPRCKDARGRPAYCSPNVYEGTSSRLYRNKGDGTFADASVKSGISRHIGRSMGAACADYNGDGWIDIYVSNDLCPNFLFINDTKGGFREEAVVASASHGENGSAYAGMGVDCGDYDNDGNMDLVVTNFEAEPISVFRGAANATYTNESFRTGIGSASLPFLKWGCRFVDLDLDGFQDLFVANGHVDDYADERERSLGHAQTCQILRNEQNGTFTDVSSASGPFFTQKQVARGAAFGDYDNNGTMDVLVITNNGPATLLRNDTPRDHNWIRISLAGDRCNPEGLGARVKVRAGAITQTQFVRSAGSYLADHDHRLLFGIAKHRKATAEIRWPCGAIQTAEAGAGEHLRIKEKRCAVQ